MDWIDLAHNRSKWRALVNVVMTHKMWEISWLAANLLASQEGLRSMELFIYLLLINKPVRNEDHAPSNSGFSEHWTMLAYSELLIQPGSSWICQLASKPVMRLPQNHEF